MTSTKRDRVHAGADRILKSIERLSENEGKSALTLAIMAVIASTSDNVAERMQQIETLRSILLSTLEDEAATPRVTLQ